MWGSEKQKSRMIDTIKIINNYFQKNNFKMLQHNLQDCKRSVPIFQFSSVQLPSRVRLFVTPWTTTHQASLSIINSQSLSKLMSTELVMPSNHLILYHSLLLLPSIFPSIMVKMMGNSLVFSNELVLPIRWPKYWSFSFSISPSNEYSGLISFGMN